MASNKRPLKGRLLTAINVDDAPARGLGAALGLPPDESDKLAYVRNEFGARWVEFDKFFGLKGNGSGDDIWQQRAKALVAYEFDVDLRGSRWWERFTTKLAIRYVSGFSLKGSGQKKHGAPSEWNNTQLCQLFADVEFLKKTTRMSVRDICKILPRRKGYAKRWGRHGSAALCKAYATANKRRRHLIFQFELCGAAATIPANRIDHIEAAIKLHALKN
jgi:hypothetical protein